MPSMQWKVEPVYVCRRPVPVFSDVCELETVANAIADKILTGIKLECETVCNRTLVLRNRIDTLNSVLDTLNAKSVKIPYRAANAAPMNLIKSSDNYRTDNRKLICQPVFKEFHKVDLMDIETQKPASLVSALKLPKNVIIERAKSPLCKSNITLGSAELSENKLQDITNHNGNCLGNDSSFILLPSPKEQTRALAEEFPSSYVRIDVTGTSFQRMSSFRTSLIHRRNTYSESTSNNGSFEELDDRKKYRRRSEGYMERVDNFCQTEKTEEEIYKTGRLVDLSKSQLSSKRIELKVEIHHQNEENVEHIVESIRRGSHKNSETSDNEKLSAVSKSYSSISPLSAIGVSVKMREPSTSKNGDDGRSSSGNWSASSSTHASVDSDNVNSAQDSSCKNRIGRCFSNSSLEKDSVISEFNAAATHNETSQKDQNGYLSDASAVSNTNSVNNTESNKTDATNDVVIRENSKVGVKFANRDSESWLQYFEHDSSETITPTEMIASDSETITSTINSPSHEKKHCSVHDFSTQVDDELESVYSVDNDGYYTSMHTDSGLLRDRPKFKLMITPNSSFRCKGKRDSISSVSTIGDISINSILSKTETETSSLQLQNKSPKRKPLPPARTTSLREKSLSLSNGSNSSRSHSPSPVLTNSESEHSEVLRYRLRSKTLIDATTYPSLCAALTTSEGSDEEVVNSTSSSSSESFTKKRKLSFGAYKRFRIKDIFGSLTTLSKSISKSKESISKKKKSSPVPFNMYGESKIKADMKKVEIESNENDDLCVKQTLTTFDIGLQEPEDELEVSNNTLSSTKLFPTHRYCPNIDDSTELNEEKPKRPKTLFLPEATLIHTQALDSNEKIVYTSNSLGRRRDGHPMNYLNKYDQSPKMRAATIPSASKPKISSPFLNTTNAINNPFDRIYDSMNSERNSPSKRVFSLLDAQSILSFSKPVKGKPFLNEYKDSSIQAKETNEKNLSSNLTTTDNGVELKNIESINNRSLRGSSEESTPDADSSSASSVDIFRRKKSKLSTEDLLVLIHNSKKKMCIKTDTSPSDSVKSLSPINRSAGNRLSWAGSSENCQNLPGNRHSLAIDRLGQGKHTSINDFKRLLSQARVNNNTERKSAAELLKATSPLAKRPVTPVFSTPRNLIHSESRTRVINGRVYRSPYKLETMYPPIEEVGSEENLKVESTVNTKHTANESVACLTLSDLKSPRLGSSTWV
ncbi:Nance-Horan syndrome protein-like protein [Dinothrombium tinctorium]|uniref:Nance-Horan syndrome protein-like protein n=1 Tax=Dinothrombium tinctorium TaxID=1965070 RepID=A0A3S3Q4C5_9ACAR|nr:Nance-Horan syndrome protein-like protein [Dinothrombium tinctorium]